MPAAAILAGGLARRFDGRAKALLPLGSERIVDRLVRTLRQVVDDVVVMANDRQRYRGCGVPVHADRMTGRGPGAGIHAALTATGADQLLVVAGDMPFVTTRFLAHLLALGRAVDVAVPRPADGYQPLCASYRASCLDVLARRLERDARKVSDLLAETTTHVLPADALRPFDPHGILLFNINTPADYARALTLRAYHQL